ncbi:MAG: hypothetical protein AAFP84_13335 [Actinomycetota bacterium]
MTTTNRLRTTAATHLATLAVAALGLVACGSGLESADSVPESAAARVTPTEPPATAPALDVGVSGVDAAGGTEPSPPPLPPSPIIVDPVPIGEAEPSEPVVAPIVSNPSESGPPPPSTPSPSTPEPITMDLVPLGDVEPSAPADPPIATSGFERVPSPQPPPATLPAAASTFDVVTLDDDHDPVGGGDGGLVLTAATGCAHHCIADATIHSVGPTTSGYELRVELDSAATVRAYVSGAPIETNADGRHVPPSSEPTAIGTAGFRWSTVFDLEPSTTYHLLVTATDEQGTSSVAGSFTTAELLGPDALTVPVPCADGCLTWVDHTTDTDGTGLSFSVEVDVDASLELAWSTEQFIQTDDGPMLEDPRVHTVDAIAGSTTTMTISGLTPNTAHFVQVTATDAGGGTDRMVAAIATPSPTILVGIDRIVVRGDGDDGRHDRGEIGFLWGSVGDEEQTRGWGSRGEATIPSNSTIRTSHSTNTFVSADAAGDYPAIVVYAGERDGSNVGTCFVGADGDWRPNGTVQWCGDERITWSNTWTPRMTLAEIQSLPACTAFEVEHVEADRCIRVQTAPNSSDQVSLDVVIWFGL